MDFPSPVRIRIKWLESDAFLQSKPKSRKQAKICVLCACFSICLTSSGTTSSPKVLPAICKMRSPDLQMEYCADTWVGCAINKGREKIARQFVLMLQ